jgi:hypothetical protein
MTTRTLAPLALTFSLLACKADNNASVEIVAICAPPDDAVACAGSGECGAILASDRPWVYLEGGTNRLELFMQLDNLMADNSDAAAGRTNTHDAYIQAYRLSYRSAFFNYSGYQHPANVTVRAETSVSPVIPLIPEAISGALSAAMTAQGVTQGLVIVDLEALGELQDGTDVEAGPFAVAVDVHNDAFPGYACPNATDVVKAV